MKEFLQSIADDAKNIFGHDIEATKAYAVPGRNDPGLTFGRDQVKKGKLIETCVLFIDIRNSTLMSRNLKKDKAKLGKIYSAFIDAMVTIADRYGYVRNIIGDRVMVVFEPNNCFVNAIECAVTMYTVAIRILKKYSSLDNFKVGIGVEYGEMLILKTGIQKKHDEQSEYKNLVWVGDAANIASKLTDYANKSFNSPEYKITYEKTLIEKFIKRYNSSTNSPLANLILGRQLTPKPEYGYNFKTVTLTTTLAGEEFHKKVTLGDQWKFEGYKIINIEKKDQFISTSPILMSGKVYAEFKKTVPKSPFLIKFERQEYPTAPNTGTGIFGGSFILPEITEIKL